MRAGPTCSVERTHSNFHTVTDLLTQGLLLYVGQPFPPLEYCYPGLAAAILVSLAATAAPLHWLERRRSLAIVQHDLIVLRTETGITGCSVAGGGAFQGAAKSRV